MPRANPALAGFAQDLFDQAARARRGELDRVVDELAGLARVLAAEPRLRRVLVDPGLPGGVKRALLADLGRGRLRQASVTLLAELVDHQRVGTRELVDLLTELTARAAFTAAEQAGTLARVEDELFRFGALVQAQPRLRSALTDPALPVAPKQQLVADLLAGKADPHTTRLVALLIDLHRGRDLDTWTEELAGLAAERRHRVVAEVRTAVPLDQARQARLAEVLRSITGKPVELRCTVDTSVLGSVVARIGDEVFDGSVRSQLQQARAQLGVA